jgi:hypothetical protein
MLFAGNVRQTFSLLSLVSLLSLPSAAEPQVRLEELLERGIYTEQTRGDLDSAIQLYRQIVAEAKSQNALAAEAQYRLALCLHKKNQHAESTAAFEKLAKDYPDQKELVAQAEEFLAGALNLLPVPWQSGETLRFDLKLPNGKTMGAAEYSVVEEVVDGRKVWVFGSNVFAGVRQSSRAEVDAASFWPIRSVWRHTSVGEFDARYSEKKVAVSMKGRPEPMVVDLNSPVFDNEQALALMRRLPLASNYKTKINLFPAMAATGSLLPLEISVSAIENVTVAAGSFECFRVDTNIRQTFWFSTDARRQLVKLKLGGLVGELRDAVVRPRSGQSRWSDDKTGVSLQVPNDWLIMPREPARGGTWVNLLEADGLAILSLRTWQISQLPSATQNSVSAFAEHRLKEFETLFAQFKKDQNSWTEGQVDGEPAIIATGEFTEAQARQQFRAIYVQRGETVIELVAIAPASDFPRFQPHLEALVQSVQLK